MFNYLERMCKKLKAASILVRELEEKEEVDCDEHIGVGLVLKSECDEVLYLVWWK